MAVLDVHERILRADARRAGELVASLASGPGDLIWPSHSWPSMRLDPGLKVEAKGGHGPIRYTVIAYEPGLHVRLRFSAFTARRCCAGRCSTGGCTTWVDRAAAAPLNGKREGRRADARRPSRSTG